MSLELRGDFVMRLSILIVVAIVTICQSAHRGQAEEPLPALPAPTTKPSTMSFDQLRAGIQARYNGLWAIEVDYEQSTRSFANNTDGVVPLMKHHFAIKGEKRYRSQLQELSSVAGENQQQLILAYDGDVEQTYVPQWKQATVAAEKQTILDQDAYLQALAIPLSDADRASVSATEFYLPYTLSVASMSWRVQPTLETVDGAECHVLEADNKQRIWIDPANDFAMRFREVYQRLEKQPQDDWPLATRFAFRSLKQFGDRWMPMRNEIVSYTSSRQPENQWNEPSFVTIHDVKRLETNDQVQDSLFSMTFPPGTEVRDPVHERYYRVGDSNEELAFAIEEGLKELPPHSSASVWFLIANVIVFVGLVGYFCYRIFSRRLRTL